MVTFFYITALILAGYGILIEYYRKAWNAIPGPRVPSQPMDSGMGVRVTVVVPARNEEKNISDCLISLLGQSYPREWLEVIVVNDFSTDQTEATVLKFCNGNVHLLNLAESIGPGDHLNSYKKKAIALGVDRASGELIITTDADCRAPKDWVQTMVWMYIERHPVCIAAPVKMEVRHSLLSIFQSLDFIALQGITGAAVYSKKHSMCNGANFGYKKEAFYAVDGFQGIDQTASGDDMLLMHKMYLKFPGRVVFLKSKQAIVSTLPLADWRGLLFQRIRWASKADKYQDKRIFWVLLAVYLLNAFILTFLIGSLWYPSWLLFFLGFMSVKTILEYPFVSQVASFFDQRSLMKYFFLLQPLHMVYIVSCGLLGQLRSFEWKGREVK
jgi:cellulose synthase/poly-beta-1,6-N-acetylglucosamine synthase-like glycosyltransferase